MIEINLLEQKKPLKLPIVMGVDLAKVSFKPIIIAIMLTYVPDYLVYPQLDSEIKEQEAVVNNLNKQLKKLNKEVRGNKKLKSKLDAFNAQVEKLKKRSEQVEQIIKDRTNPTKLLERLARNMPKDMWLTGVDVTEDRKIAINGKSTSYKSIGAFILSANESSFFGKTLTLSESRTETDGKTGERVEVFKIVGTIESYDPFRQ